MNAGFSLGIIVATIASMSVAALAQDPRDRRLADEIAHTVGRYTPLSIFDDISAQVDGGAVVLTGQVTMPYKKSDLEKRVTRIDGVRSLRNDIRVLPVSQYDQDLRYRVARAIYSHPTFWNYAAMANPPIHIIVDGGHVTLAGVVNSAVERMLARSLATGLGELSVTNALRTDAETRSE